MFFYVNLRHGTHDFTSLPKKIILGFLRSEKMPRSRPGLNSRNLGSSGEYDNYGTTGVDACLLIDGKEKRKKRRRKRFWMHNIHNKRNDHGEFHTLFPDLMEDVKFFQYFIHCACVFYFVRFSRDENADSRFVWYRSQAGISLWHHQQEPHAAKKLLSREFEPHFPVVDSCGADLWTQPY